jgi:hypothetical protein
VPYYDIGHYQSNTLAAPFTFQPNMHSTIETKKRKQKQTLPSVPGPSSVQVDSPQVSILQPGTFERKNDFNKSVQVQVEPAQFFTLGTFENVFDYNASVSVQVKSPQVFNLQKPGNFENIFDFNAGSYADDTTHYSVPNLADQSKFVSLTAPNSNFEKPILLPYSTENVQLTKGDSEATIQSHSSLPMTSKQHFFNVQNSKEYAQQTNSHKDNPFRSYQSEDSDGETEPEPSEHSHRFRSG